MTDAPNAPHVPAPCSLRPYQQQALVAIAKADARGVRRQVVSLPTGSGKTIIFAQLIHGRQERTMILVHRDELIHQTLEKLAMVARGSTLKLGVLKAERDEHAGDVVVASVQTLQREPRLHRITHGFDLLIVDECHHALRENTYGRILTYFNAFEPGCPLTVGFTATPFRPNNDPIITTPEEPACFDEVVFTLPLLRLITQGYLSPLVAKGIFLQDLDLDRVRVRHGDYVAEDLSAALMAVDVPKHLVRGYEELASGRRALIFCPTVAMATAVEQAFKMTALRAATVVGTTPLEERQAHYQAIRHGTLDALVTCAVLTEGFDEPSIDCIMLARPTKSKVLFFQCVGRGVRLWPQKADCLLVDVAGATRRHGLLSVAAELGLLKPKETGTGEERPEASAGTLDGEQETNYHTYDIDLTQRTPLHWVKTGKGYWVVNLADRMLRVRPDGYGTYRLEVQGRTERGYQLIVERLSQEWCFGIASDTAQDAQVMAMVRQGARWREKVPSARLIAYAQKMGVGIAEDWTSGQVSDAIQRITGDWYD